MNLHEQYNLPRHMQQAIRADYNAAIEVTPGGPILLKRKARADVMR